MRKNIPEVLWRALKKKCPSCGKSPIFKSKMELYTSCPSCGMELLSREPDTWFFMYISTTAITGIFLLIMIFVKYPNRLLECGVLIALSIPTFFCTLSIRKSLAIAVDYLSAYAEDPESKSGDEYEKKSSASDEMSPSSAKDGPRRSPKGKGGFR